MADCHDAELRNCLQRELEYKTMVGDSDDDAETDGDCDARRTS